MSRPLCPNCKADISRVKPVRIATDPDSLRWKGEIPDALGFVCPSCDVLLPLSPTVRTQDA
jgi:predicted RNA-binding Zn-ribbon protein involved in translation (DUF1610 family)